MKEITAKQIEIRFYFFFALLRGKFLEKWIDFHYSQWYHSCKFDIVKLNRNLIANETGKNQWRSKRKTFVNTWEELLRNFCSTSTSTHIHFEMFNSLSEFEFILLQMFWYFFSPIFVTIYISILYSIQPRRCLLTLETKPWCKW